MKIQKRAVCVLLVCSLLLILSACGKTKTPVLVDDEDLQDVNIQENPEASIDQIFESLKTENLIHLFSSKTSGTDYEKYEGSTGSFKSYPDLEDRSVLVTVHILECYEHHDSSMKMSFQSLSSY